MSSTAFLRTKGGASTTKMMYVVEYYLYVCVNTDICVQYFYFSFIHVYIYLCMWTTYMHTRLHQ